MSVTLLSLGLLTKIHHDKNSPLSVFIYSRFILFETEFVSMHVDEMAVVFQKIWPIYHVAAVGLVIIISLLLYC